MNDEVLRGRRLAYHGGSDHETVRMTYSIPNRSYGELVAFILKY